MASIADILIAKGNAAAAGTLQRGNIYADLIRNLSSIPGQAIQQQRQLEQDQLKRQELQQNLQVGQQNLQLGGLKIDEARRQQQDRDYLGSLLNDPTVIDPNSGRPNQAALMQRAQEAGHGHQLGQIADLTDHLNKSIDDAEARADADRKRDLEGFGQTGKKLAAGGYDPGSFHTAVTFYANPKRPGGALIPADQANQYLQTDDPAQIESIVNGWRAGTSAEMKPVKLEKDTVLVNPEKPTAAPILAGPKGAPTETELALTAAGGDPVKAMSLLKPPPPPRPIDEQLLEAVTKGDRQAINNISTAMRTSALARQDPAAAALALQLKNLSVNEAQARLDKLREDAKPLDITPNIQTTVTGKQYLDGSTYTGSAHEKAVAAAGAAGVPIVNKEQADALSQVDNARANQRDILSQIESVVPESAAGRPGAWISKKLADVFQTDDQKAAFGSWRTAAINTLRATAGAKGLRINQAEISQAIENDIPKLTDTLGVARQKVANITTLLNNVENSIVVRNRAVAPAAPPTGGTPAAPAAPGLSPGLQGLMNR